MIDIDSDDLSRALRIARMTARCDCQEKGGDVNNHFATIIYNNHDRMTDEITELREALLIARDGYANLIELGALPNNGWNGQAKDLIGTCDKALTKHK